MDCFIIVYFQCPFGRVVYVVKSQELANQILGLANTLTAAALGLSGLEQDTLRRTLSTYKLTKWVTVVL